MKYDESYYLNFSPRMQRNLVECGFEFVGEPQIHIKTQKTFYVYEKNYELQLFLAMFRLNNERNLGYKECQIYKAFREGRLLNDTSIEDYEIKENAFTKFN